MAVLILNARPRRHGPTATVLRAIVTTSSARLPLNLLSTQSTGAVRVVRTVLGAGGYRIVGVVNVPDMQTHAEVPAVPTCIAPSNSATWW